MAKNFPRDDRPRPPDGRGGRAQLRHVPEEDRQARPGGEGAGARAGAGREEAGRFLI